MSLLQNSKIRHSGGACAGLDPVARIYRINHLQIEKMDSS